MITQIPRAATAAAIIVSAMLAGSDVAESTSPSLFAEALRAELSQTGDASSAVGAFYAARDHEPLWLSHDGEATPAARALIAWAAQADAHGLPSKRYKTASFATELDKTRPGAHREAALLEFALTRLYLTYARDLSSGLLEPSRAGRGIHVEPRRPDPTGLMTSAAEAEDMADFLDGLAPRDPGYATLVALYAEMRQIAASGEWGDLVPAGGTLRPGDRSDRVTILRGRLIKIGDMDPEEKIASGEVMNDATSPATDQRLFDPALEAAVRRFQERHGLNTDGVVGPMTLAAINTSAAERASQVAVNLERMRWLNYDLGWRHIYVNTAAFTMEMFEGGERRFFTRTVVGKPGRKFQTPEFNDELEFIVVNPYWNVPYSIASQEILPLLQENPAYLDEHNMELLNSDLPPSQIDWSQVTRGSFPGRLRQRAGAGNALGDVKFLFPNRYSVYMHDTPSRRLFARDRRAFSHGCIRLHDPTGFAHLLLSLQYDDPAGTYDRLRGRYGEQWVTLEQKIPVYVSYRTAWRDGEGRTQFRADVYRRDSDVLAALAKAGVGVLAQ